MQYINYPAKTLMKSSRVVFTMIFGVLIQRKVYKRADYFIVLMMVVGLATFMHADASSSAVFHHMGVIMLVISLFCDGAISNVSETIMNQYGVGQDEFIFRLYSIALMAITAAAAVKGDFSDGMLWMFQPGTYQQFLDNVPMEERTWSVSSKVLIMVLFSSMGFFGSSCSAAITKNFGALTMSITSTARKATTLFLSFFLFHNVCTTEHIVGIAMFITALTAKSLRRRHHTNEKLKKKKQHRKSKRHNSGIDRELPQVIAMTSTIDTTPERLTFRHQRASSNDGTATVDQNSRTNLVHVV
jgi:drug/metabolite transporter (DMT)-like permease